MRIKGEGILSKLQHFQWRLYQHTYFVWSKSRLTQDDFVIVTAHNPKGKTLSHFANRCAHQRLIQSVRLLGYSYSEIIGQSPDGAHQELSLAVACSLAQGYKLAKKFQQNAIYWVSRDKLSLHGVRFAMSPVGLGCFSGRCLKPEGKARNYNLTLSA